MSRRNVANAHKAWEHCRESQPLGPAAKSDPLRVVLLAQGLLSAQQEAQKAGPRHRAKATTLKVPKPKGRTASTDLSPAAKMNWFAGSLLKTKCGPPLKPDALCTRVQSYFGDR